MQAWQMGVGSDENFYPVWMHQYLGTGAKFQNWKKWLLRYCLSLKKTENRMRKSSFGLDLYSLEADIGKLPGNHA